MLAKINPIFGGITSAKDADIEATVESKVTQNSVVLYPGLTSFVNILTPLVNKFFE